uniref:Virion infectivity factor n=1 Tax=Caprine arthritis encephalitis virus TaxID=11660 RepID=Q9DKV7_CAEV|nr:vif protein [Caprine arthritis encephalitis virus]
MQNLFRHRRNRRDRRIGPELPLSLWTYTAYSINKDPAWYTTLRLQQMMWHRRGNKLTYVRENAQYEEWEMTSYEWRIRMRRDKTKSHPRGHTSPWQYRRQDGWKDVGTWFLQPGDYRKADQQFWFAWRIVSCSCKKEGFNIREFMLGTHRWDLCKSCCQGEVVKRTQPYTLQRLTWLKLTEDHVFQVMPLWRARKGITIDFPWCRDTKGFLEPWTTQECWQIEYPLEDE